MEEHNSENNTIVKQGNQQNLKVCGIETVLIKKCINGQWENGGKWEKEILKDVLYVPDF